MKTCSVCKREWEEDAFRVCPIDGAPLEETLASTDAYIGKTIGRCRIVEKIADADLGPIYKAEDPVRGVIAIQITPPDRVGSPVLLEAFADAVNHTARLNHPHVVRIHGMETGPDGSVGVIMELVKGTDLGGYRRRNPDLGIQEACTLARMIAEGVLAAHRLSIFHGALHPSRILITPDRNIKVGGFHRSALREGVDAESATAANLPYLAPEQVGILRDAEGSDYRTDIYSLGVILYEVLTGRLPYNATNIQDFAAILEGAPPLPPSIINSNVSPLLSRVVGKALSRHPVDRQESMDQFIHELNAAQQPIREPETPPIVPYVEPRRPLSAEGSGLFAPQSSGEVKHDSVEDLWPEVGRDKDSTESGSRFSWFKTRVGNLKRREKPAASQARRHSDDSSYTESRIGQDFQDGSEIHTVVVSGNRRGKAKKRNLWDTLSDFGYRKQDATGTDQLPRRGLWETITDFPHRRQDSTGTGRLPRRHLYSNLYIIVPICLVVAAAIVALLFYFSSLKPEMGTLEVDTEPSNAILQIRPQDSPEARWEISGRTPQTISKPVGKYSLRVALEEYTPEEREIEISKSANPRLVIPLSEERITGPTETPFKGDETGGGSTEGSSAKTVETNVASQNINSLTYEQPFRAALSNRYFFLPAESSAWKYLQNWEKAQAGNPSPALEQARTSFCRALEEYESESLKDRKWKDIRDLLVHVKFNSPDLACAAKLQDKFKNEEKEYKEEYSLNASAAIKRQNYVTPSYDCALFYVRSILSCDDTDEPARTLERRIFELAWDQAQKLSKQRHHQESLDVYNELDSKYPNPPNGKDSISQAIQKETRRLALFNELNKPPLSIAVKHKHSARWPNPFGGECTGMLVVGGLEIEYKTAESEHRFKITYDELTAATKPEKDKIEIQGNSIRDGKIRLEQENQTSARGFNEIFDRINYNRKLYDQYKRIE